MNVPSSMDTQIPPRQLGVICTLTVWRILGTPANQRDPKGIGQGKWCIHYTIKYYTSEPTATATVLSNLKNEEHLIFHINPHELFRNSPSEISHVDIIPFWIGFSLQRNQPTSPAFQSFLAGESCCSWPVVSGPLPHQRGALQMGFWRFWKSWKWMNMDNLDDLNACDFAVLF